LEKPVCDAEQGLETDAQQPPAGMPGGGFEDTLRSAVLHLLLSFVFPVPGPSATARR
jgi:hypothetical protein